MLILPFTAFVATLAAVASVEKSLYLVDCSIKPQTMLDVGIPGVMCEFTIRTDTMKNPMESVVVSISNSDQSELLPNYVSTLSVSHTPSDIIEYANGISSRVHAVSRQAGVASLVVIFPYDKCTITGSMLVMRVLVGTERAAIFYRQPNICARANVVKRQAIDTSDTLSGATSGTFTFLIVFALFACVILCVASLFL